MFTRGNSKLGKNVHTFSIPAKKTCPQATPTCLSVCYARHGRYRTEHVVAHLRANAALARRADFDRLAAAEIVTKKIRLLRVHVAGDMFSSGYTKAWVRIVRQCPETTFWLYTRSWRNPKVRTVLKRLAALPNVRVWFSADVDTGVPKNLPRRVRVAWLMTKPGETPPAPVDLVFRTKALKRQVAETVTTGSGTEARVCPTETGTPAAAAVTCESCRRCFEPLPGDPRPDQPTRVALTVLSRSD